MEIIKVTMSHRVDVGSEAESLSEVTSGGTIKDGWKEELALDLSMSLEYIAGAHSMDVLAKAIIYVAENNTDVGICWKDDYDALVDAAEKAIVIKK
jgi:hypothetical protein